MAGPSGAGNPGTARQETGSVTRNLPDTQISVDDAAALIEVTGCSPVGSWSGPAEIFNAQAKEAPCERQ